MAEDQSAMSSNRPYLLRAIYDWIGDNGLTPYLLVDAAWPGVRVPSSAIRDGRVVLNIAMRAVANLDLGNERIRCMGRFGGVSHAIDIPIAAVQAIYAHENGQGMMFPPEQEDSASVQEAAAQPAAPEQAPAQRPSLQTVASTNQSDDASSPSSPDEPPPKGRPNLRVIK